MKEPNSERWSRLWLTATNAAPPPDAFSQLVAMYSEPHRHYHNLRHIAECLNQFDSAKQLASNPAAVELAIWFHDAIYDTRAGDNEERSAKFAVEWLRKANASVKLVTAVEQLVLATKTHDASLHVDAPLLVDVDLSILAQSFDRFWEYERAIREEYDWVETSMFNAKRTEILDRFLKRERIYVTDFFFDRMEAQARANLRASVQHMSNGR